MLALHLALTGLPGVAAALAAMRLGVRDVPVLLGIALAASGVAAFIAFWAYFADPTIGQVWNYVLLLGSIQVAVLAAYGGNLDRDLLRRLRIPLLLWVLGSVFVVYLGFLHGGTENAIGMSGSRYAGGLPSDNDIPRYFAEWFAAEGHHGTPPVYPPDWLMSDRPPLQIGYVLSQESITVADTQSLHYEILCSVVQQLWIVGLYAVLVAASLRRLTVGLVMFAALASDVAILYGFYVWPKLIAAAFLLAALALVISPRWTQWRRDWRIGALLGALLGARHARPRGQHLRDHPGRPDRRLPRHPELALDRRRRGGRLRDDGLLVGLPEVRRPARQPPDQVASRRRHRNRRPRVAGDDRRQLPRSRHRRHDRQQAGTTSATSPASPGTKTSSTSSTSTGEGETSEAIVWIRIYRFFELLPMLGLLLIGPIAMAIRRRHRESEADWSFALTGFAFVGIGCFFWALLQWGTPGESSAIIHAGTTEIPLIAIAACVAAMASVSTRLAIAIVAINAVFVLVVYAPSLTPLPGTSYSPLAAILAALGLLGYGLVALGDGLRPALNLRGGGPLRGATET